MTARGDIYDDDFYVTNDAGDIILKTGLDICLNFSDGHTTEKRTAFLECIQLLHDRFSEQFTFIKHPVCKYWCINDNQFVQPPKEWLHKMGEAEPLEIKLKGGEFLEFPDHFNVGGLAMPNTDADSASYFRATFPLNWFEYGANFLDELIHELCTRLQPNSGTVGIGIIESPLNINQFENKLTAFELASKNPELLIHNPQIASQQLNHKILSVAWQTILGDDLLRLIDVDDISSIQNIEFNYFNTGIIIKSGDQAALKYKPSLTPYIQLQSALSQLQITAMDEELFEALFYVYDERYQSWLSRFSQ